MDFKRIRPDVIESIRLYVEHGCDPGDFLTAVLENNLKEALGRADDYNRETIFDIVGYCYNEIPSVCWGSPVKIKACVETIRTRTQEISQQLLHDESKETV